MMVMEKTRDIAVMMSFGVEPGQVRRIFLLQGLLISLIGTAVASFSATSQPGPEATTTSSISRRSLLHRHPAFAPRLVDGLIVAAVSIGISLLATLYPSSAAARVLPAEALRFE